MSADLCLLFLGLRFDVDGKDVTSLETREHSLLRKCREFGLDHYWGNFGAPGERYLLFVGKKLGVLGPENTAEIELQSEELVRVLNDLGQRLGKAGFDGEPRFFAQWHPDA